MTVIFQIKCSDLLPPPWLVVACIMQQLLAYATWNQCKNKYPDWNLTLWDKSVIRQIFACNHPRYWNWTFLFKEFIDFVLGTATLGCCYAVTSLGSLCNIQISVDFRNIIREICGVFKSVINVKIQQSYCWFIIQLWYFSFVLSVDITLARAVELALQLHFYTFRYFLKVIEFLFWRYSLYLLISLSFYIIISIIHRHHKLTDL